MHTLGRVDVKKETRKEEKGRYKKGRGRTEGRKGKEGRREGNWKGKDLF